MRTVKILTALLLIGVLLCSGCGAEPSEQENPTNQSTSTSPTTSSPTLPPDPDTPPEIESGGDLPFYDEEPGVDDGDWGAIH